MQTRNFCKKYRLKPNFLLGFYLAILAILPTTVKASPLSAANLIDLTNQVRAELALPALAPNHKLTQAAYGKAQDILEQGYFAHTNPSGKPFYQWLEEEGYNYLYAGENLAIDFNTNEGVVTAWLASPSHRANIINENYQEIGLVALRGPWQDRATTVVVQMFGATLPERAAVLGQAVSQLADKLNVRKDNFAGLAADIILLPSLAGRKYFDVLSQGRAPVGLALSNPTAASIASSPITKIAQGDTYRTLLKSETSCCQTAATFALTAEDATERQTIPIGYPNLNQLFSALAARPWPLPHLPQSLSFNMMLAGLAAVLLSYSYQKPGRRDAH